MSLRKKQSKFSLMLGKLILHIYEMGYEMTPGHGKVEREHGGHSKNSLHYIGLAQDINLFKDGKYLTKTEDHEIFGLFWEKLGGSWGGRFNDGNHYSLEHNGRK